MSEAKISGISVWHRETLVEGCRILASFDVRARGLELRGCSLVVGQDGHITAWPPKSDNTATVVHKVRFLDGELKAEIAAAAVRAYEALDRRLPEGASL